MIEMHRSQESRVAADRDTSALRSNSGIDRPAVDAAAPSGAGYKHFGMPGARRLLAIAAFTGVFCAGVFAGGVAVERRIAPLAYAAGACIAMEMAAAHGMLDERQKRIALAALSGPLNTLRDRFPVAYRGFRDVCDETSRTATAGKVGL